MRCSLPIFVLTVTCPMHHLPTSTPLRRKWPAKSKRPDNLPVSTPTVQQSASSLLATAPATGRTRKPCRVPVKAREGAARDTGANQVPWTENALGSCRAKNTIRVGYGPRHRSLWYETSAVFKKCRGFVPGSLGRAFLTEGPRPPRRRHSPCV